MSARYELIDAEKATVTAAGAVKYSIVKMCEWLGVSSSGYYEWQGRPASATAARRDRLKVLIAEVFTDSDGTYGHRRVHAQLARWGEHASLELVRGLMRELGLVACQPRPWRHSLTEADAAPAPIPDLVRRDFTAEAPGRKMVGDITYIPTWEGWVYLATVLDCHTKQVLGWAIDENYKTPLISAAIGMAARSKPSLIVRLRRCCCTVGVPHKAGGIRDVLMVVEPPFFKLIEPHHTVVVPIHCCEIQRQNFVRRYFAKRAHDCAKLRFVYIAVAVRIEAME